MTNKRSPNRGLTGRVGAFQVDWPRSAGYFGGVGLATALGLLDPPVALFIAAVPFIKMLNRADAATPLRYIGQFFEGMAQPVGGDAQGTITLAEATPAAARSGSSAAGTVRRTTGAAARHHPIGGHPHHHHSDSE